MLKTWISSSESNSSSLENEPQIIHPGPATSSSSQVMRRVNAGACAHCKSLKIRCEYLPEETVCVRCKMGNYECISRGRKKRRPAPTHEDLLEQSRSQDLEIQDLLRQLDQMHTDSKIKYWISKAKSEAVKLQDRASLNITQSPGSMFPVSTYNTYSAAEDMTNMGALLQYHRSRVPTASRGSFKAPAILRCGFLRPYEIYPLFHAFFERINPHFPLLDPRTHTPEKLVTISPFLFTMVCALATRFCAKRPQLHRFAMELAIDAATEAFGEEFKTVETCQAYLLLSVYPVPKKNLTDDRRWLLMAIAIRIAQELKMSCNPPSGCGGQDRMNLIRTWICIVNVDKEYATQFGRPPMIQSTGHITDITRTWYRSSPFNMPGDILICSCSELYSLMDQFWHAIGEDMESREVNSKKTSVAMEYDKKIADLASVWHQLLRRDTNATDQSWISHIDMFQVTAAYLRLVVLSTGLHNAVDLGVALNPHMLSTAIQLAQGIIQNTIERLYPAGILPFIVEAHLLYITFAAAFLINVRKSRFSSVIHQRQHPMIIEDVERLISILGSRDVVLDSHHAPSIFSKFLASLLGGWTIARQQRQPNDFARSPSGELPQAPIFHQSRLSNPEHADGAAYWATEAEPDVDFSLGHFVESVSMRSFPSSGSSSPSHAFAGGVSLLRGWVENLKKEQTGFGHIENSSDGPAAWY